jgi:zinc protease
MRTQTEDSSRRRPGRAGLRCAALLALAALPAGMLTFAAPARAAEDFGAPERVEVPSPASPLVAIRLLFRAGSMDDPPGKEGLAGLTALMVAQAGTAHRSYNQLLHDLYPLAAEIDGSVDREVTVFSGTVTRESAATYTRLLEEALLSPGFAEADFKRNKAQQLSYLNDTLRSGDDELLGLEALQDQIFAGHPYGHSAVGTVAGLGSITLDDVREFYRSHYTKANLTIGVAGGYPHGFAAQIARDVKGLPAGSHVVRKVAAPAPVTGRHFTLIEKETASVGINIGLPLPLTRRDADYYPLMVANSFLGEHRTFSGLLMAQLRILRGLNYGDYSYIEYYDSPPFTSTPTPNVPRHQQYFSVWVRPVVPADAQFALRAALYEVRRLQTQGLTQREFDLTRNFLINYSKLWVQDLSVRLGFAMDSRYYGTPYFIDEVERRLKELTLAEVNQAAAKYLTTDNFDAVIVTAHAGALKEQLQGDAPSPKTYNSKVSDEVLAVDKSIIALPVKPTSIDVVPVAKMFEK